MTASKRSTRARNREWFNSACECGVCRAMPPDPEIRYVERTVNVKIHICPNCREEYEPRSTEQRWCVEKCGTAWRRKRAARCEKKRRSREIEDFLDSKHPDSTLH